MTCPHGYLYGLGCGECQSQSKPEICRPKRPRYRHVKTGGIYTLLWCNVFLEWASGKSHVLYQSEETAQLWVRPEREFFDGRFEEIEGEPESAHGVGVTFDEWLGTPRGSMALTVAHRSDTINEAMRALKAAWDAAREAPSQGSTK
jgi:hypothetical protein